MEKDGNYSQAVSYEFHNRIISSVEDGLLAWYDMDEISGGKILDKSGRMRHASLITGDITDENSDNVEGSPESHDSFPVENAFDNDSTTESGRWLALQSAIPVNAQYNFDTPVHISSYEIVSQNYFEELRSPKAWRDYKVQMIIQIGQICILLPMRLVGENGRQEIIKFLTRKSLRIINLFLKKQMDWIHIWELLEIKLFLKLC